MPIRRLELTNFTAFDELSIPFSDGINVLLGENGTGKTHILKVAYAATAIADQDEPEFGQKLVDVFIPDGRRIGRLVRRQKGSTAASVHVKYERSHIGTSFSNHTKKADSAKDRSLGWTRQKVGQGVYIPVKEILANAPGFRSMYSEREVEFDATYDDLLSLAYLPAKKGKKTQEHRKLLRNIEQTITGRVVIQGEKFFLKDKHGNLEFSLLAEGWRKLALIWQLIQNGTLWQNSILFWDEPETNLNPRMIKELIKILLELRRQGVQIFLVTHDYTVIRWLDILVSDQDSMCIHAFFRDADNCIQHETGKRYSQISHDAIRDTFGDIFESQMSKEFEDVEI